MKQCRTRCRPRRALLQLETLEARCAPAAGALDPTFDGDGKATIGFTIRGSSSRDEAAEVAIQTDGKIVVAGIAQSSDDDWVLVRYNPNGSLDASFGSGGTVRTPNTEGGDVASVLIQPDRKIVAVGSPFAAFMDQNRSFFGNTCRGFIVARYNSDGSLDTGFGRDLTGDDVKDGIACTGDLGLNEVATDAVLQADGKIVVVGYRVGGPVLARFNADGSLDTSFGPNGTGIVGTTFGADSLAFGVTLQDGKILATGSARSGSGVASTEFALARYNADGSQDLTFGTGGKVLTDFEGKFDEARDVAIQADGKIVVGGTATHITGPNPDLDQEGRFALVRYNRNGSLDASFGVGGKVTTRFPGFLFNQGSALHALAIQTNGKIVAAGEAFKSSDPGDPDFALARYNLNGSLDTTFGEAGLVKTSFSNSSDLPSSIALQSDGRIVVAGTTGTDTGNPEFAVARYEGDPTAEGRPAISFAISPLDGQVYRHRLDLPGRTSSSWTLTAPGQFRDIAVTEHGAGHAPVVFGLGVDQQIYLAKFSVTGDLVIGWIRFAPGFFDSLDAGTYGSGKPFVVGIGERLAANNEVFVATFDAQANLVAGWLRVAPGQFSSAVVGQFGSGSLEIFGVGRDDPIVYAARFNSSGSMIDGWVSFAPGDFSTLSVGSRTNGTLELFGLGLDRRLYAANFSSAGLLVNGFFPVTSLDPTGPNLFDLVSVAPLSNNHLKAFALPRDPSDHRIFTAQFDTTGVLSSGWTPLSAQKFTFLDTGSQSGVVKLYGVEETESRVYLALFNSLGALSDPFVLTAPGVFVNARPAP